MYGVGSTFVTVFPVVQTGHKIPSGDSDCSRGTRLENRKDECGVDRIIRGRKPLYPVPSSRIDKKGDHTANVAREEYENGRNSQIRYRDCHDCKINHIPIQVQETGMLVGVYQAVNNFFW